MIVSQQEAEAKWFKPASESFTELKIFIRDIYNMAVHALMDYSDIDTHFDNQSVLYYSWRHFQGSKGYTPSYAARKLDLEGVQTLAECIPTLEMARCFKSGFSFTIKRDNDGSTQVRERYIIIPHEKIKDYPYLDEDNDDERE